MSTAGTALTMNALASAMDRLEPDFPHDIPAFREWCAEHGHSPTDEVAQETWIDQLETSPHDGFCARCGDLTHNTGWIVHHDPFGTGDSPTEYEQKGSECCGANVVDVYGRELEMHEFGEQP